MYANDLLWDADPGVCCAAFQLGACPHTEDPAFYEDPAPAPAIDLVLFVAEFTRGADAEAFYDRLNENPVGWWASDLSRKPRSRTVTWMGPDTNEHFMDMLETVGYYGSPPQGPQATLRAGNRQARAPRTY